MSMQDQDGLTSPSTEESSLRSLRAELAATKRALVESEGRYRQLIENCSEGAVMLDGREVITFVNEQMAGMLGYTPAEMVGRPYIDFIPRDEVPDFAARMSARRSGKSQSFDRRLLHRHGDGCWFHISAVPIFDADGRFQGSLAFFTNVTVQKHAEALLTAERDLAVAFSEVHSFAEALARCLEIAIAVSGMDAGAIYLRQKDGSLALAVHAGLSDAFVASTRTYLPDSPHAAIVCEGQPRYATHRTVGVLPDERRLAEGLQAMAIIPIRERGEVVACLNIASHENDEIPSWSREALEDVAARIGTAIVRTRAEEAQRQSEKEYKILFDEMLDSFAVHEVICDDQGEPVDFRYLAVNPAFERLTRMAAKDVVGRTVRDLNPNIDESWIESCARVAIEGTPAHFERYVPELKRHLDITLFRPSPGRFAAFTSDITSKKLLEARYGQAQKMEAVGRLAGGVAHDLNNLLTPILGYAEILREDFSPNDVRLRSIHEMYEAGMRARDLVHQLLAFSRKQTLDFKPVDLSAVVRGFEKLLRRTLRENIRITTRLEAELGPIRGDVGQLEQIVMNLAVNAQDAMPSGGELLIKTATVVLDDAYAARYSDLGPGRYAELSISDTGTGMSEEVAKNIFEPFFTTKELGKGTGLGLATVYGVVKQHGGGVLVYSEVDVGTTFRLLFPMTGEACAETASLVEEPSGSTSVCSETVVVVEDDDMVRNLTASVLKRQGYTVIDAANAQACLTALQRHGKAIDLVLTDVIMPGMNGKALFELIASKHPQAKVIYLSGYPRDVLSDHGILAPDIQFLQKPFSVKVLSAKVREVLER